MENDRSLFKVFYKQGGGCSSVGEYLPNVSKVLGSVTSAAKRSKPREIVPSPITLKPHMMGTESRECFSSVCCVKLSTGFNVSKLKGNQSKEKQKDTLTLPTLNHGFFLFPGVLRKNRVTITFPSVPPHFTETL